MSALRERIAEVIEGAEQASHGTGYNMDWAWDAAGDVLAMPEIAAALERQGERYHVYYNGEMVTANAPVQDSPDLVGGSIVRRGGPDETWAERAEAFRRGMSDVDQAGDMLAELRAQISDLLAERGVAQFTYGRLVASNETLAAESERERARAKRWKGAAKRLRTTMKYMIWSPVARRRAARWKAAAIVNRSTSMMHKYAAEKWHDMTWILRRRMEELTRERDDARAVLNSAMDEFLRVSRERDEARAALMKRITRDAA